MPRISDIWGFELPLFLVFIGLIIIVAAVRNTLGALTTQLASDLTGGSGSAQQVANSTGLAPLTGLVNQGGFLVWFGAILAIGLLGYIPKLELISRGLLGLVLLTLFLKSGTGFFSQLQQQLSSAPTPGPVPPAVPGNLPAFPVQSTSTATTQSGVTGAAALPGVGSLAPFVLGF